MISIIIGVCLAVLVCGILLWTKDEEKLKIITSAITIFAGGGITFISSFFVQRNDEKELIRKAQEIGEIAIDVAQTKIQEINKLQTQETTSSLVSFTVTIVVLLLIYKAIIWYMKKSKQKYTFIEVNKEQRIEIDDNVRDTIRDFIGISRRFCDDINSIRYSKIKNIDEFLKQFCERLLDNYFNKNNINIEFRMYDCSNIRNTNVIFKKNRNKSNILMDINQIKNACEQGESIYYEKHNKGYLIFPVLKNEYGISEFYLIIETKNISNMRNFFIIMQWSEFGEIIETKISGFLRNKNINDLKQYIRTESKQQIS